MKQKKKNEEQHFSLHSKLIYLFLGLATVVWFGRFIIVPSLDFGNFQVDEYYPCSSEQIAQYGKLELPPSVENQDVMCLLLVDSFDGHWSIGSNGIEGRFDISADDLDSFLESTVFDLPLVSQGDVQHLYRFPDELDTNRMDSYLYGWYESGNYVQEMVIDTSNSEQYTVYIEVLQRVYTNR